eukprot:m.16269 g.16269  ORF g.16269 m.16269 type:complete len:51 (+) comp10965_c0_seq1:694-846(+)
MFFHLADDSSHRTTPILNSVHLFSSAYCFPSKLNLNLDTFINYLARARSS